MNILAVILLTVVLSDAGSEIDQSKYNWRRVHNTDSSKEIDYDYSGKGVSYHDYIRSQIENKEEELNAITYFEDNKNITVDTNKKLKSSNKRPYVDEEWDEIPNYKEIKTTCEDFGENSYFHPKEIFYKTWVSFYKWATYVPNGYVTKFNFTIPRRKLVYKLGEIYQKYSKEHIHWKLPKFSMMMNYEHFVIIANDKTGGFDILIEHAMDDILNKNIIYNIKVPKMRMKLVGPYLVIMFCGYPTTMVYACLPRGHIPLFVKEAADSIGIIGGYGRATRFKSSDFGNSIQKNK